MMQVLSSSGAMVHEVRKAETTNDNVAIALFPVVCAVGLVVWLIRCWLR